MKTPRLRTILIAAAAAAAAIAANEVAGKPIPMLRWSVLRFGIGGAHVLRTGQVGDGRERALATYVAQHARRGDIDDVIRVIDEYAQKRSFLMNVGDEKGELLDAAIRRTQPTLLLELGTYCGYSALRTVRAMPDNARLYSIEPNPANAAVARQVWEHAGVADRVTAVVRMIGDSGATIAKLRDLYGVRPGSLDFLFLDHLKSAYLPDLKRIHDEGWLHPGSVVVADNVKIPGAPAYLAYMRAHEATMWQTIEHETHVEYQKLLKDLVLESTLLR